MANFAKLYSTLSNLPVSAVAETVVSTIIGGKVAILSSATGSGKTLVATSKLADTANEQVVVCVPRRFLAVNAAETIAELAGLKLGQEVGYAVGKQSGEQSLFCSKTKLLFVTYGYAISSGLVNRASTIVLDEVHEASMDMSIVRALLHRRLASDDGVRILEMSATINSAKQADYWGSVSETSIFEVDGQTFPCERMHSNLEPHEEALELIQKGRKGILVFRPGMGEVKETAEEIQRLAGSANISVEVSTIYGEMGAKERRKAVSTPRKGGIKVLVGTNVVESGANISWLDSGVSCGTGKELVARDSGAVGLDLIDLSKWRLEQQEGRVKRFCDGIFVLCSRTTWDERPAETIPELERLPLTELVMHCAVFGLRAEDMTWDVMLESGKVESAETKLQRLGLVDENCKLTAAGKFVSNMPVSPEVGAMLWHAKKTGVLGAALPLAAVIEVGGVRKNFKIGHDLDNTSDWLDGLNAFKMAYAERDNKTRKELMEQYNISYKRFEAAKAILRDLQKRFNGDASSTMQATPVQLRQCITAGWVDRLFDSSHSLVLGGSYADSYRLGNGSVISSTDFVVGELRTIKPRHGGGSFTVLEKATKVTLEDLVAVAGVNSAALTVEASREKVGYFSFEDVTTYKLFGEYEVAVIKVESPLTAEEEAQKAELEAVRESVKSQLVSVVAEREVLGLESISFNNETFSMGWSNSYSYTEEGVAEAQDLHQQQATEKREQLRNEVADLLVRASEFNIELTMTDDIISFAGHEFALSQEVVNQLSEQVRSAEKKRNEAVGRERLVVINQRLEALGRNTLTIDSDGDVSWHGYKNLADLPAITSIEEDIACLEAEAKAEVKHNKPKAASKNMLSDLMAKFS